MQVSRPVEDEVVAAPGSIDNRDDRGRSGQATAQEGRTDGVDEIVPVGSKAIESVFPRDEVEIDIGVVITIAPRQAAGQEQRRDSIVAPQDRDQTLEKRSVCGG